MLTDQLERLKYTGSQGGLEMLNVSRTKTAVDDECVWSLYSMDGCVCVCVGACPCEFRKLRRQNER